MDSLAGAQILGGIAVEIGADLTGLRAGIATAKTLSAGAETSTKIQVPVTIAGGPLAIRSQVMAAISVAQASVQPIKIPIQFVTGGGGGPPLLGGPGNTNGSAGGGIVPFTAYNGQAMLAPGGVNGGGAGGGGGFGPGGGGANWGVNGGRRRGGGEDDDDKSPFKLGRLGMYATAGFALREAWRIGGAYVDRGNALSLAGNNSQMQLDAYTKFNQGVSILGPIGSSLADSFQSAYYGRDVSATGTAAIGLNVAAQEARGDQVLANREYRDQLASRGRIASVADPYERSRAEAAYERVRSDQESQSIFAKTGTDNAALLASEAVVNDTSRYQRARALVGWKNGKYTSIEDATASLQASDNAGLQSTRQQMGTSQDAALIANKLASANVEASKLRDLSLGIAAGFREASTNAAGIIGASNANMIGITQGSVAGGRAVLANNNAVSMQSSLNEITTLRGQQIGLSDPRMRGAIMNVVATGISNLQGIAGYNIVSKRNEDQFVAEENAKLAESLSPPGIASDIASIRNSFTRPLVGAGEEFGYGSSAYAAVVSRQTAAVNRRRQLGMNVEYGPTRATALAATTPEAYRGDPLTLTFDEEMTRRRQMRSGNLFGPTAGDAELYTSLTTRSAVANAAGSNEPILAGVLGRLGSQRIERMGAQGSNQVVIAQTQLSELGAMKNEILRPHQFATQGDRIRDVPGGAAGISGKDVTEGLAALTKAMIDLGQIIKDGGGLPN